MALTEIAAGLSFQLSEEQLAVRDAARDFARTELLPGVIERDEHQAFPTSRSARWANWVLWA
jgi:alkylation response protein AidB-like acyl-CoA dehydrogenase